MWHFAFTINFRTDSVNMIVSIKSVHSDFIMELSKIAQLTRNIHTEEYRIIFSIVIVLLKISHLCNKLRNRVRRCFRCTSTPFVGIPNHPRFPVRVHRGRVLRMIHYFPCECFFAA